VFNFTGDVIGALGVSGPVWRMTDEVLKGRAKQVRAAAARLSAEFGAKG
jgi:DNA-binding IclR family transcriptional regulator